MTYPLKTRIISAVSLLTFGLMLLSSWLILAYFENRFRQSSLSHLADSLAVTAKDFQEKLNHSQQVLESIAAKLPHDILNDQKPIQEFLDLQSIGALTFDNGIFLLSAEGRLQAIAPLQPEMVGMDFSFRDYYRITIETRQSYISDPFWSRQQHHHPVIALSVPILDETRQLKAILGGSIDLFGNNFLRHLLTGSIGRNGYFVLLDQTNTLIMHPEKDLILRSGNIILPQTVFNDLQVSSRGYVDRINVGGKKMLAVFQHLTPIDWTLVALYPADEVYGPIHDARLVSLGVLAVLTLFSFLIVRKLIDRLTAPLTHLTMKVRELSDPDAGFSLSSDGQYQELGALADSIQTLMADVSDKRSAMKEQILFLQNLMETIPHPVFYKDSEFRYLGCNTLFTEFFSLPREELLGKKVTDVIEPDLAAIHVKSDQELWRQGGQISYEREMTSSDGATRYVLFHKKVFRLASGEPGGLIGTCLDITERRKYEQELRQALHSARAAEEQVSNILRSVSDGLIVTDWSGRIIHINTVAEDIIGLQAVDVVGKRFTKLFANRMMREGMRNFISQPDLETRCQDFVIPQDEMRPDRVLQARSSVMLGEGGNPIGLVTILQDVTQERNLDRIKSEFISTAAHELRTPVTVIMGYAELLLDAREHGTFCEDQAEKFLHDIFRMGDTLSRLVEDLLDISRIEAGLPVPLEYEPCPVSDVAQELLHRYRAHHAKHTFVFVGGDTGAILADGVKLAQVFENLLSNAVKYSPQGGTVSVGIDDKGDFLEVQVADEGDGMTPYQVERIFDRFYRADSSNTSVGGLGIGMSIVKSIVEGHGGSLVVESSPGKGTRVHFRIPKRPNLAASGFST